MVDLFGTDDVAAAVDVLHGLTAVYTRDAAVEQCLDTLAWPASEGLLVDTSCGDGAFLTIALRRLLAHDGAVAPDALVARIEGWEIHGLACDAARARVAQVLVEHGYSQADAQRTSRRIVHEGDFLTQCDDARRYDFICGNPPYLRWVSVPAVLRDEYEGRLPRHAHGDMLYAFLDRCAARLNPGGRVSLITSDRWLSNDSSGGLREELGRTLSVGGCVRLDAGSAFHRPKDRRAGTAARVHPVLVVLQAGQSEAARPLGREAFYVDACDAGWATTTLGEVASVRLGPWLGTAGVFVVDSITALRLPADDLVPAVDTDDVEGDGFAAPKRFALRTRPGAEPRGTLADHLRGNIGRMAARGRGPKWWMPPERLDHLDLSEPCLVVPRIVRELKALRLDAGVLVINHNLMVVSAAGIPREVLRAAMLDPRAKAWVGARADRLEGGYLSIKTALLRSLPLALNTQPAECARAC